MSLPKFDPWRSVGDPRECAYRAYPARELGTLGTIGTGADPEMLEFGSQWQVMAAPGRVLAALALLEPTLVQRVYAAAMDLCRSPWLGQLELMGRDRAAIFAIDESETAQGGLVQSLVQANIVLATADAAYLRVGDRLIQHGRRSASRETLPLVWDVIHDRLPRAGQ